MGAWYLNVCMMIFRIHLLSLIPHVSNLGCIKATGLLVIRLQNYARCTDIFYLIFIFFANTYRLLSDRYLFRPNIPKNITYKSIIHVHLVIARIIASDRTFPRDFAQTSEIKILRYGQVYLPSLEISVMRTRTRGVSRNSGAN